MPIAATAETIAKRTPPQGQGRRVLRPRVAGARVGSGVHRPAGQRRLPALASQSEEEREQAVQHMARATGGVLVVDDTGDVGRNFQQADVAFHVRLPANPNSLEQRIGRIDRYGHEGTAQQYVLADDDRQSITSAWLGALVRSFGIFDTSISALQEVVEDLTDELWAAVLKDGVEAVEALAAHDHGRSGQGEAADQRTRRPRVELRRQRRRAGDWPPRSPRTRRTWPGSRRRTVR